MRVLQRLEGRSGVWRRLIGSAKVARTEIRVGRFQRGMAVMTAFAAIVSGFESYMQHLRGAFSHWLMWTPVVLASLATIAAGAALFSRRAARRVLPVVSSVTLADGVIGFIYHIRRIREMPGGLKLGQYNLVMGPPVFAPLLMCIVGALGGLASLLRPERGDNPAPDHGARLLAKRTDQPESVAFFPDRLAFEIAHGRFQQGLAMLAVVFAILSGGEAYFEHLRGSFNQRVMWRRYG